MSFPNRKWTMLIDMDKCTGCGACVVACHAENNVPIRTEEDVARGLGMHWMRTDHYWVSKYPEPQTYFLPMLCQQCYAAPCEPVCPVFATLHSPQENINLQVYNRCVGTRYCGNNCPYQVRAFNWRDYTDARIRPGLKTLQNQLNPDVTVRRRGVMEKCTFCIQRIHKAEDNAKAEGREIRDGEFTSACAQACPANAITFGRIDDPTSKVSQASAAQRGSRLFEELGTLPRVTYLAGGV